MATCGFRNEINKNKIYWKTQLPGGMIYNKIINNYCVGIISTMIKKRFYKRKNVFNVKYNHIGDFDLFIKLSRKYKFGLYSHRLPLIEYTEKTCLLLIEKMKFMRIKDWFKNNKKKLKKNEKKIFIINRIQQK